MINNSSIIFPNLGITLKYVGRFIELPWISIAYYGVAIALGMLLGISLIQYLARKSGQNADMYFNLCMGTLVLGVVGARIYYVLFSWKEYKNNWLEIFNIRGGGLGIYGGILTGLLVLFLFSRWKRYSLAMLLDTIAPGVVIGQILGRWGNFFNREAFGEYTNNLFAMALPKQAVYASDITDKMLSHLYVKEGIEFIQVHPTFLYESVWNILVLVVMLFFWKRKSFDGQIAAIYFAGYGIGRFLIERLRTDQLLIWKTNIPVSMVVSAAMVLTAIIYMIKNNKEKAL